METASSTARTLSKKILLYHYFRQGHSVEAATRLLCQVYGSDFVTKEFAEQAIQAMAQTGFDFDVYCGLDKLKIEEDVAKNLAGEDTDEIVSNGSHHHEPPENPEEDDDDEQPQPQPETQKPFFEQFSTHLKMDLSNYTTEEDNEKEDEDDDDVPSLSTYVPWGDNQVIPLALPREMADCPVKYKIRYLVRQCFPFSLSASECIDAIESVYGRRYRPKKSTILELYRAFRSGDFSLEDKPKPGGKRNCLEATEVRVKNEIEEEITPLSGPETGDESSGTSKPKRPPALEAIFNPPPGTFQIPKREETTTTTKGEKRKYPAPAVSVRPTRSTTSKRTAINQAIPTAIIPSGPVQKSAPTPTSTPELVLPNATILKPVVTRTNLPGGRVSSSIITPSAKPATKPTPSPVATTTPIVVPLPVVDPVLDEPDPTQLPVEDAITFNPLANVDFDQNGFEYLIDHEAKRRQEYLETQSRKRNPYQKKGYPKKKKKKQQKQPQLGAKSSAAAKDQFIDIKEEYD